MKRSRSRSLRLVLASIALAVAINLDWQLARPHHGRFSFDWKLHWLTAIPVFALLAWYVVRKWPDQVAGALVTALAIALVLAQGVEPLYESVVYDSHLSNAFSDARLDALAAFMVTGIATAALVIQFLPRRPGLRMQVPADPGPTVEV